MAEQKNQRTFTARNAVWDNTQSNFMQHLKLSAVTMKNALLLGCGTMQFTCISKEPDASSFRVEVQAKCGTVIWI
jgi:hypothetical protein